MSILDQFGVSHSDLEEQFAGCVLGRTLILDGDAACYKAAATAKKLDTVIRRFKTSVYEYMYLTKAEFARVHLTPKNCYKNGRHLLLGVKPYQMNRSNKAKPPLLEPLRSAADTVFDDADNVVVIPNYQVEADDALMQDAYAIQNAILWSEDKDLFIAPCDRYDHNTGQILRLPNGDRYGWIDVKYTESGTPKYVGHGTKFFWMQMLMGDTADNVKGIIKFDGGLCGGSVAFNALDPVPTEDHAANLVINAYREIDQNPLPEAEAMWLTRTPQDTAAGYIWSLNLTPTNREFIKDCFNRKYRLTEEEYKELYGDIN